MNLLKKLFSKKEEAPILTYDDFWKWFRDNEKLFYRVVKERGDIERDFFEKLSPKLNELRDGYFYLTGMCDENTVELVFTADGSVKNIVFVEELVRAAPPLKGWRFTALKPATDIKDFSIGMEGFDFSDQNISFYPNEHSQYPDEIDLTIVHQDYDDDNRDTVVNGTYIFLDNYLGELDMVTNIDQIEVIGKAAVQQELIPIGKLKDYLAWRQKEFIEKYEGLRYNSGDDSHSMYEAELPNGRVLLAVINASLLEWDRKASHPWILVVEISYDGEQNNGMPDEQTYQLLDEIEDQISEELRDSEGYLNIGRQTADSVREIYYACKDFRKPSKVLDKVQGQFADAIQIGFDIYKDKYWRSFNRFQKVY